MGNFLILKGEVKVRIRLGCLKRSHITEKLTNANTTKMPKTEILAIIAILPEDKITADYGKDHYCKSCYPWSSSVFLNVTKNTWDTIISCHPKNNSGS